MKLFALIPMILVTCRRCFHMLLICIQYVQEKETAKNILQGIKMLQSGFPSMDIDHFAL
jgi:hypothetical protein